MKHFALMALALLLPAQAMAQQPDWMQIRPMPQPERAAPLQQPSAGVTDSTNLVLSRHVYLATRTAQGTVWTKTDNEVACNLLRATLVTAGRDANSLECTRKIPIGLE